MVKGAGDKSQSFGAANAHQDIYFVFSSFHDGDGNR
jgi:hypothetical protein